MAKCPTSVGLNQPHSKGCPILSGRRGGLWRHGWGSTMLALLLFVTVPLLRAQEDSGTTLKLDVKLVDVFVNVTDANGAIVGSLTKEDFALFEDGRPQTISLFERQSEMPLNITLAIDTSGSVRKDLTEEANAARHFVHAIMRPQDQMSLIQFATEVRQLTPFTSKPAQIDRGLGRLQHDSATALYDAVCSASAALGRRQGRKVLVIVSDGDDTVQNSTYAQALEAALRNEVMVYSLIDVPIEASAGRATGGEHALITLAEQTGGKHYYVTSDNLDKVFQQVSEDLRTEYLLGYYPRNQVPGRQFHRITVRIPRAAPNSFEIRNRTGYYTSSAATEDPR